MTTTTNPVTVDQVMHLHPEHIRLYNRKTLAQSFKELLPQRSDLFPSHKADLATGFNAVLSHNRDWYGLAVSGARKVVDDRGRRMTIGETIALYRVCREQQIEDLYYAALDELLATGGEHWDDATRAAATRLDRQRAGRYGMLARMAPVPTRFPGDDH